MPIVAPFRGLHYAPERFGPDLSDLVCPPYDVIDAGHRAALLERHERNAVRLELAPGRDPHRSAAETLHAWRSDGTLVLQDPPSVYEYTHATPAAPDQPTVRAIVARVLLQAWGDGVKPHEHTMPGPKADRLGLLRSTRAQLSPILALYADRSPRYRQVMGAGPRDRWHARDADGLLHTLTPREPRDELMRYLADRTLFVADGHHRYETALAHQAEVRSDPAVAVAEPGSLGADWIMVAMVNAEAERLEILPTHRIVLDADADALRALTVDAGFSSVSVPIRELPGVVEAEVDADRPAFGLVLPDGGYLLVADREVVADRMRREAASDAVRILDLSVLHAVVLRDRLGITGADVAAGGRLAYTRSASEAIDRVTRGDAAAAILVRPTRLEQLVAVATAGDVMPQKSTYFYPKLLTGMVFNPLEN